MARAITPLINEKDSKLMEGLLKAGHVEHKYAVRLQTVPNRAKGFSTNSTASFLGINLNSASNYVKRYNEGGAEALLKDKTRKPGTAPIPDDSFRLSGETQERDALEHPRIKQTFWRQPYRRKYDTEGEESQAASGKAVSIQH
jgi:hypothetical protein